MTIDFVDFPAISYLLAPSYKWYKVHFTHMQVHHLQFNYHAWL